MTEMIKNYLDKIQIGAEQSYKNLAMFPLLSGCSIPCNKLTMDEALSNDIIERRLINKDRSVPKLNVIKKSNDNECVAASWDYIEQFARVEGQIGAVFQINGKVAGMVYFGRPEAFGTSFIKIVECYAKKAADEFDPTMDLKSSKSEVINFLRTPRNSRIETHSTAGMGIELGKFGTSGNWSNYGSGSCRCRCLYWKKQPDRLRTLCV